MWWNTREKHSYSLHQQNGRSAVALGANFELWTVFPKLLWGCIAVATLRHPPGYWGAGVLAGTHQQTRRNTVVLWWAFSTIRELPMPENLDLANATRPFRSFPLSPLGSSQHSCPRPVITSRESQKPGSLLTRITSRSCLRQSHRRRPCRESAT